MAKMIEGTGVIVKTSSASCVVSVTINGSSKSFLFNKRLFYTFGVPCEGSMTNILEDGMEVELCYKMSGPEEKYCILAVWLGDKPDIIMEVDTSKGIYDVIGRVVGSVDNYNFLIQDKDNNTICINKGVVFRDGSLLPANGALAIDEEISFDAIPFELEHPSGAAYQATCAWIGAKPGMVDRFDLRSTTEFSDDIVEGTVAVIPNDVVAIVDVVSESVLTKVLLFRSSFRDCRRLGDVVDVGDSICMRLGYQSLLVGRRWWYAVQASKSSCEITLDSCKEDFPKVENNASRTYNVAENVSTQFGKDSEVLFRRPPLSGVISPRPNDHFACITFGDVKIFLHRDNFYMDKKQCSVADFMLYIEPGNNDVFFEAILSTKRSDPENFGFTHEAVCAWVGRNKKPGVDIVGASFIKSNPSGLKKGNEVFHGFVMKYYLPNLAFAYVPEESSYVFIHVSYFGSAPCYPSKDDSERVLITNYVKIGDRVQFKLQENPSSPGVWGYDIRLVRFQLGECADVNSSSNVPRPFSGSSVVNVVPKLQSDVVPSPDIFTKKCLSQGRGFLLNCSGTVITEVGDNVEVKIKHSVGNSVVMIQVDGVMNTTPEDMEIVLKIDNTKVRFDAVFDMSPTANRDFRAVRMWPEWGSRLNLSSALSICSDLLFCSDRDAPSCTMGKITSIPLPDSAIAAFDDALVLVSLESLVSVEEINLRTSTIDSYLSVGDRIIAKIEKVRHNDEFYFNAVQCFFGENLPSDLKADTELVTKAPRPTTWANVWGMGELYRKEPIVYENGKFLVKFVCGKRPDVVCNLDLFEKGNVFVNGKLADMQMVRAYVGQEITFHAAHTHSDKLGKTGKGVFVACAWIGTEPPAQLTLKEILAVPKESVSCPWRYEAVVQSFPLPTHALCFIGHVPILVLICDSNEGCKFADLKVGDRLVVTAHEDSIDDCFVVLSNDLQNLRKVKEVEVKEVYKNFTGTVVSLPEPVGKIKLANTGLEVFFELCHVRRFKKKKGLTNKKWFADVRGKITVGKQVYVSAVKASSKKVPYRAFEVYFYE